VVAHVKSRARPALGANHPGGERSASTPEGVRQSNASVADRRLDVGLIDAPSSAIRAPWAVVGMVDGDLGGAKTARGAPLPQRPWVDSQEPGQLRECGPSLWRHDGPATLPTR